MHESGDLLQRLDGLAFLRSLYPDAPNPDAAGESRVLCPFHADTSPSCDYNVKKNVFRCLACGSEGSAVDMWAARKQIARHKAIEQLADLFGVESSKVVSAALVESWHVVLCQSAELLAELQRLKGVTPEMVVEWRIGWDGDTQRLTIPVRDARGRCINVKKYDLFKLHPKKEKYISLGGHGEARLFPEPAMEAEEIHLVEGEIKMQVHRARQFNAITETGGAHTWKQEWSQRFQGKRVYLIYDIDGPGQTAARNRAADLTHHGAIVKNILLPLDQSVYPKGGIEDWYLAGGTREDFLALMESTSVFVPDEELQDPAFADETEYDVLLGAASRAEFYHRKISAPVIVSAKDIAPYVVPKTIGVRCRRGAIDACATCPVATTPGDQVWQIQADREELLEMLETSRHRQHERIRSLIGIPQGPGGCRAHELISLESQNVEELRLVPQLGAGGDVGGTPTGGEQTVVKAYYVGHGLETNAPYQAHGRVVANPEDQHATLILGDATPNVDSLSTFKPSQEELDALRVFQPASWTVEALDEKLDALYQDFECNVSRVYHRRAMHLLMDLVWHSVLHLPINGEAKKGWLDCLVIGDSGQGKSETFMRLLSHYGLGEWVDMKGASVAGLKGGLQDNAGRWWVTWGAIPLNDRRMVILDEVKGCAPEVLQALTSMRSSGLAEVQKIERRRAWARTRLLWLSNPRSDRKVETYNYGIQSIKELFGSLEDVRRFDAALVVASNEVGAGAIAEAEKAARVEHRHTSELCRRLILWGWSRGVEDVILDPAAVDVALAEADRQGKTYASGIPLVEPADHRLKLLRLAAALACRTYSVEETSGSESGGVGELAEGMGDDHREGSDRKPGRLIVRPCHVEYVARFLDHLYSSRFMGYDEFSKVKKQEETIVDVKLIRRILLGLPFCKEAMIGFSRATEIRLMDVIDWTELDKDEARKVLSAFVRANALSRKGNSYYKNPPFIEDLRLLMRDVEEGREIPKELSREF